METVRCLLTTVFQGDITTLSGVYTFAFLGVMTLFSIGTILLKFKRPSLPREVTVSYGTTLFGIFCVSGEGKVRGFHPFIAAFIEMPF